MVVKISVDSGMATKRTEKQHIRSAFAFVFLLTAGPGHIADIQKLHLWDFSKQHSFPAVLLGIEPRASPMPSSPLPHCTTSPVPFTPFVL